MARWHQLRHKVSGAEQRVADLAGYDLADWEVVPLSRKPTEDDDLVDGKLVTNRERKARREKDEKTNIPRRELVERLLALEARCDALEASRA